VSAESVGVVDVDEVGFDVMRDGLVVLWFPEGGLAGGAIEPRLNDQGQLHQLIQKYMPYATLKFNGRQSPVGKKGGWRSSNG
jgi:hypothetical protein